MVFALLTRGLRTTAQRGVRAFRAAAPRAAAQGEAPIPAHMPEGIPVKARGIIDTRGKLVKYVAPREDGSPDAPLRLG